MVYQWKMSGLHKVSAQTAGEVCEQLDAEGRLTAEALVEASRPEDAPLHKEFEWNDSVAAEEWRKQQARMIINALVVCAAPSAEPVRAYFKVSAAPKYESLQAIVTTPDKYSQLLKQALGELAAFQRKYRSLKELDPVFAAFEQLRIA